MHKWFNSVKRFTRVVLSLAAFCVNFHLHFNKCDANMWRIHGYSSLKMLLYQERWLLAWLV